MGAARGRHRPGPGPRCEQSATSQLHRAGRGACCARDVANDVAGAVERLATQFANGAGARFQRRRGPPGAVRAAHVMPAAASCANPKESGDGRARGRRAGEQSPSPWPRGRQVHAQLSTSTGGRWVPTVHDVAFFSYAADSPGYTTATRGAIFTRRRGSSAASCKARLSRSRVAPSIWSRTRRAACHRPVGRGCIEVTSTTRRSRTS